MVWELFSVLPLFISELMPSKLKTCLYVDVDMLVLQDLRELFNLDLEDKIAGVVKDIKSIREHFNTQWCVRFLGKKDEISLI